jgi:hypothetical protein
LKIKGPQGGGAWIFSYTPEDVLAAISLWMSDFRNELHRNVKRWTITDIELLHYINREIHMINYRTIKRNANIESNNRKQTWWKCKYSKIVTSVCISLVWAWKQYTGWLREY